MKENQFLFCHLSIVPVRADKKDQSEIVTQLLFGEVAILLDQNKQWLKIRSSHDNYEGWIDEKQVLKIAESEHGFWVKNNFRQKALIVHWKTPFGVVTSVRGSNVPNRSQFKVAGMNFESIDESGSLSAKDIVSVAKSYLNAPYLWGGRTPFGIDCSGFTQAVYRFFNINLPRDAYQQAELGNKISFEDKKEGDIVFFENDKGKIHHVGILIEENKVIHANGRVRIDLLTEKGIFKKETNKVTHNFYSVRRLEIE